MVNDSHDWRPLSDIWSKGLPWDFPLPGLDRQNAIANAIRSGEVAVRGRLAGYQWGALDRIEKRFCPASAISVLENTALGDRGRYVEVEADLADVGRWVRENALPRWYLEARAEEGPRSRRGRPPKIDWNAVREEAFRLMDHHGDFSDDDPEWNAQARLEEELLQFCHNKFGKEPSPSRLRDRENIPSWLADWRNQKQTVGN